MLKKYAINIAQRLNARSALTKPISARHGAALAPFQGLISFQRLNHSSNHSHKLDHGDGIPRMQIPADFRLIQGDLRTEILTMGQRRKKLREEFESTTSEEGTDSEIKYQIMMNNIIDDLASLSFPIIRVPSFEEAKICKELSKYDEGLKSLNVGLVSETKEKIVENFNDLVQSDVLVCTQGGFEIFVEEIQSKTGEVQIE
ncbi:hypothetical protein NADFUDRAFT_63967 [Nadsonia fulvescens var. elongata DSM 6958]|uniref:Uncharacterized protein n=1 Tax=Nadsonia fulvescens var. elongata DSM 6958 TaxID=857566 RepID=A0A1E3PT95_9ASCO|nr:hypothetical protein NADFUDRAFT_63967 [Nadsonia fulvescens var. elongata DSM 6958]